MLDVTKAIEESADTFFYQVAFMMGIDRIHSMLSQFGYGKPTGIDLNEEYAGCCRAANGSRKCINIRGIRAIRYRWASAGLLDSHADSDGKSHGGADQ